MIQPWPWPEAGFDYDTQPRPHSSPVMQARALRLLFWSMLTPLLLAFAIEPGCKIGSAIAGVLAVAWWIRRDLKRLKPGND